MYSQLKNILISASPFLVSIPFSYFNLNNFNSNEPRALWQPPGYVFGIVWSTLYALLFIMNYIILSGKSFSDSFKNTVARDTLIEAALQGLWLNNFRSQQGINKTNEDYFISMKKTNRDLNGVCDECKKEDESVTQNLILTGFKICKSCRISKTIFPI